jgi:hypothetical protein
MVKAFKLHKIMIQHIVSLVLEFFTIQTLQNIHMSDSVGE